MNSLRAYILESAKENQPIYIHNKIPVVFKDGFTSPEVNLNEFVKSIETKIPIF